MIMNLSKTQKISVVIADDHFIFREGLRTLIDTTSDIEVLAEATDGGEAVSIYREIKPDVLLLDLNMPVMDGYEALQCILKEDTQARVLMLTTYEGEEDIYRSLKFGALGYLLKDADAAMLFEAIQVISQGKRYVPARIAAKMAERVCSESLTRREQDVLVQLVKGLQNKEIADKLEISDGTVKVHLNAIFRKLKVTGRTEAIRVALQRALVRI